nr:penicillin-binding protein 2 [Saprospiraceae bacterium]
MTVIQKEKKIRFYILIGLIVVIGIVFIFKLGQLQLADNEFIERARSSAIYQNIIYPPRGLIYDRNKKLLTHNEPIYDLEFTYHQLSPDMDTLKFCQLLGIDLDYFKENIEKDWSHSRYSKHLPTTFLKMVSPETFAVFQEHLFEFPGFEFTLRNVRSYPHQHAAHILGYISEVNREIIDSQKGVYNSGDYYGASGVERIYEPELRGNKGIHFILKDNLGRYVGPFSNRMLDSSAVSGKNHMATIDLEIQAYAEELLRNKKGSVVAIEPSTGEVLVMASSPGYDPNKLTIKMGRGDAFLELVRDSLNPLFNRGIQAKYPPGSIFKPILALVALQEEILTVRKHYTCQGAYYYRNSRWGCEAGPGTRNVSRAIQQSCNSFFYQTYRDILEREGFNKPELGLKVLNDYLNQFGLGKRLGIDLHGESPGYVPNNEFYRRLYASEGGRWYSTYTLSNAIGQGELDLTTLQMANLVAALANRGHYFTPHLIKGVMNPDGNVIPYPRKKHVIAIDPQHFEVVIDAMESSISAGSGRMANIPGLKVCGKTGTSQNPHGENHSVFFAFAPKDDPQIAIAVYVENAGWGSSFAAPIAGLIIEKYLNKEISVGRQWIENRMMESNLLLNP